MHSLVKHYLGFLDVVVDTMDRMDDYGETSSLYKDFSIPDTRGLLV